MEYPNPYSPIVVSPITSENDDDPQDSQVSTKSFPDSPNHTEEQAGSNTTLNKVVGGDSPKKNRSITSEESNFMKLFSTALDLILEFKNLELPFIESVAIDTVKESFMYHKGNRFTHVDFEKPEVIYAFVRRYGLLSAGLTRCRISEALSNCKELKSQISASSVKIISLGSGPGCDIIGFSSALYEYIKYRKVKFTLVDKYKGWKSVFNVIEFLTREGVFGNASLMFQNSDVSTTFLRKDLSDDTDEDEAYLSALKEADVVLITRVFAILMDYEKETIAKTVVKTMKVGALLLFIESPTIADKINIFFTNLKLIYKSKKIDGEWKYYNIQEHYYEEIAKKSNAQIYVMKKTSE